MSSVWCVTFATTEKNFARKRDALEYLRRRSLDERIRPVVVRRCAGAYTYYGPGREEIVLRANIDHLGFTSIRPRRR